MPIILVTGGSGFLGAHIVAEGVRRGIAVRPTVRGSGPFARLKALAPLTTAVPLDLGTADETPDQLLDGVEAVIHCAAYGVDYRQGEFQQALATNVAGTMRLAAAAAERDIRFVHVGTSYEYGTGDDVLREDRRLAPSGVYGVTKAAATLALLDLSRRTGAQVAVVRPFTFFGPLEGEHKIVPLAMRASVRGEALAMSPGEQQRDYLYVGDVADACLRLATTASFPSGEVLNICSGKALSLREIANAAAVAIGGDPGVFRWGAKPYRPAESMRVVGDPSRARAVIGWTATTSLIDGMRLTARAEHVRLGLAAEGVCGS